MFTTKHILFSSVIVALLIAGGFFYYQTAIKKSPTASQPVPVEQNIQTTQTPADQAPADSESVQAGSQVQINALPQNPSVESSFTVCEDRCGDGVCDANAQGVCAENVAECPKDCK